MRFVSYGPLVTRKAAYDPQERNGGVMGVAFVEADSQQTAIHAFRTQYAVQYTTIYKCEKLMQ
jgi:hypothetical protein